MKKTAKSILLVAIMAILLLALTGCGGDKLVATKSSDEYDEKLEISFKDDKIEEIVWTMEFSEEEDAESFVKIFNELGDEMEGMEVEQKGKKVVLTVDAETFAELEGYDNESISKDEIKKSLEEDGYEVKQLIDFT